MFENKSKLKIFVAGVVVLVLLISAIYFVKKKYFSVISPGPDKEIQKISKVRKTVPGEVLIESGEAIKKIQIANGKIEPVNALEQENFSGFKGFPKLGDNNKEDVSQTDVLISQDMSQAIVTVTTYKSAALISTEAIQPIVRVVDYLCNIDQESCQQSNFLSQVYDGIDISLQKKDSSLMWFHWDSQKNLLFGHLVMDIAGDVSPVYVCDIEKRSCNKTTGFDSRKPGETSAVVPAGAYSPSLEKFVMVDLQDKLNVETGKKWNLLLYASDDLSKPIRTYDLSQAINKDEEAGYDRIYSVAWSQDEKRLAVATSNRIFMFNLETEDLTLIYTDPATADSDLNLDSSALFLSTDGKYIAFVDSADIQNEETDESFNVLKRIDLEKNNEVTELLGDDGLSLKLR